MTEALNESLKNVRAQDPAGLKALAEVAALLLKLSADMGRGETTPDEARQDVDQSAEIIYDLLEKRRKEREDQ